MTVPITCQNLFNGNKHLVFLYSCTGNVLFMCSEIRCITKFILYCHLPAFNFLLIQKKDYYKKRIILDFR